MLTEINEKLQGIMQSARLDDLPLKYLPPVSSEPDNYYFISYSHLDYKSVYADIFALQAQGVNIWYDRAMPAGKSWKETAEKYIRPSRCAGVVFYVSENSLLSPAIHEEIAYAQKCGKSCLTVNLPMLDNKSHSVKEMLDIITSNGVSIPGDKYAFLSNAFGNDVLYVPYSMSADVKAEKIHSLKKPPLLKIDDSFCVQATVVAVNDTDVTSVQLSDFEKFNSYGQRAEVTQIGDCAFANCTLLKQIELPDIIESVGDYAFYNCSSLISVDLQNIDLLGDSAFEGCSALSNVNFEGNKKLLYIGARAFYRCSSLQQLDIPASVSLIEHDAFAYSGLKEIFISKNVKDISLSAFEGCRNLEKLVVDENNPHYVGLHNCLIDKKTKTLMCALSDSVLPNDGSILLIDSNAFACAKRFSMSYYYKYCGSNRYFRHAQYGDVDILGLWLPDNSVVIPQGVRFIQGHMFQASDIQGIVLPDSIEEIQSYAFIDCGHLKHICYIGTKAQWNAIKKSECMIMRIDKRGVKIQCLDGEMFIEV